MNLFEETTEVLEKNNKSWDDVEFISTSVRDSSGPRELNLETFLNIAKKTDYDEGFGASEISLNLYVVGEDWWLERYEYDGSEGWRYKEKPQRPRKKINEAKALLLDENLGILDK